MAMALVSATVQAREPRGGRADPGAISRCAVGSPHLRWEDHRCHERQGGAQHVPSPPQTGEPEMDPLFPQTCKSRPALGTLPTFPTLPGPPPNRWPPLLSVAVAPITQTWAPGDHTPITCMCTCQAHGQSTVLSTPGHRKAKQQQLMVTVHVPRVSLQSTPHALWQRCSRWPRRQSFYRRGL